MSKAKKAKEVSAYDMSPVELLTKMHDVARTRARTGSHATIKTICARAREAMYWENAVLARMEQEAPPCAEGCQVKVVEPVGLRAVNNEGPPLPQSMKYRVQRLYYAGNKKWALQFKHSGHALYPFEGFEVVGE